MIAVNDSALRAIATDRASLWKAAVGEPRTLSLLKFATRAHRCKFGTPRCLRYAE